MIQDLSRHTSDLYQNNVAEFFIEREVCLSGIDLWYKLNRFKLNSSLHANPLAQSQGQEKLDSDK